MEQPRFLIVPATTSDRHHYFKNNSWLTCCFTESDTTDCFCRLAISPNCCFQFGPTFSWRSELVTDAEFPFSTSITITSQPAGYKVENCSFSGSI